MYNLKKIVEPSVLKKIKNKVIMHIDIDCFFVQASLMSHPHLKGKPIAVTHKSQSSDISTAMLALLYIFFKIDP